MIDTIGMRLSDSSCRPALSAASIFSIALSVYPLSLNIRPNSVSSGNCVWQVLHGILVWRAKLGIA